MHNINIVYIHIIYIYYIYTCYALCIILDAIHAEMHDECYESRTRAAGIYYTN